MPRIPVLRPFGGSVYSRTSPEKIFPGFLSRSPEKIPGARVLCLCAISSFTPPVGLCVLRPSLSFVKNYCIFLVFDQGLGRTALPNVMSNGVKSAQWRSVGVDFHRRGLNRNSDASLPSSATFGRLSCFGTVTD